MSLFFQITDCSLPKAWAARAVLRVISTVELGITLPRYVNEFTLSMLTPSIFILVSDSDICIYVRYMIPIYVFMYDICTFK